MKERTLNEMVSYDVTHIILHRVHLYEKLKIYVNI